jgi:hypothetical protein
VVRAYLFLSWFEHARLALQPVMRDTIRDHAGALPPFLDVLEATCMDNTSYSLS